MHLSERQSSIMEVIKSHEPIRSKDISSMIGYSQATIRHDLSILVALGMVDAKPNVGYYSHEQHEIDSLFKKLSSVLVKDIMSKPVTLDEESSVYEATIRMIIEDCGTLFITKDDYLAGIVSRKDLLRSTIQSSDLKTLPVGLVMTHMPLIMADELDDVGVAARLIDEAKVDSVPVVRKINEKYKVIGRFSKTNITNYFVGML
jgi:predicted transcriptional regulator